MSQFLLDLLRPSFNTSQASQHVAINCLAFFSLPLHPLSLPTLQLIEVMLLWCVFLMQVDENGISSLCVCVCVCVCVRARAVSLSLSLCFSLSAAI